MEKIVLKLREEISEELINKINKNANVFFSEGIYKLNTDKNKKTFYLMNDKYIMPFSINKTHGFKIGSILSEMFRYSDDKINIDDEKNFINDSIEFIKKNKLVHWINVTPAYTFFSVYPDNSQRIKFGSHVIELKQDEESLLMNMKSKHRNMVRRAEKNGIVIKFGGIELLDDYISLDKEMWSRNGRNSNNYDMYKSILTNLKECAFIAIAYLENEPQSGMLSYYNNRMMYYMFAASKTSPSPGSSNYLHWEVMKKMKELGVKEYSFVGCRINEDENSKYHSIQHFKAGFGGELREGYLFKVIINKHMYNLFSKLYYFRTKQKFEDVIDSEIYKWREIN